jgi:hypothetical protein
MHTASPDVRAAAPGLLDWLGPDAERHPLAGTLARAWSGWCAAAGGLPPISAVEPFDMVPALPWVWIWGMDAGGTLRLRLVGEEAKRAIGNWARGRALEEVCPPELLPNVARRYGQVLEGPAALAVAGRVVFASGATTPALRLVLPLGEMRDGRPVAHGLIGVTSYDADLRQLNTGSGLRADMDEERLLPLHGMA